MEQNYYTTETYTTQPRKKKGGKVGTVLAIAAVVAVVGGSAGFGGAYLAADMIKAQSPAPVTDSANPAPAQDSTDQPPVNNNGSNDISSALNAIASSTGDSAPVTTSASVTPTGPSGSYTAEELYEAVNDTIVFIKVYTEVSYDQTYDFYDYYFGFGGSSKRPETSKEPQLSGMASGIIFTEDGYVITNAHVADDAAKLEVIVNDYNDPSVTYSYDAEVVGSDSSTDVAVLKITRDEPFKAAKLGDSDKLRVGQDVCAIGNPGAGTVYSHTMTKGIISGLDRMIFKKDGYSISSIQTDAAINFGNSGGGLFDMYGNVIGIVNAKVAVTSYEGIGFALTINDAKPIMEDLLTYGYVKSRPVLGITTVQLNEYRAEIYGAHRTSGLLVASINKDAPVSKSDLRVSDIIIKVDGQEVTDLTDLQMTINKFKVGDKVTLTVSRKNELGVDNEIDIEVILTEKSDKE